MNALSLTAQTLIIYVVLPLHPVKNIIAILLVIATSLSGADYYLSPSGNDTTGDGSIGSPWFSINKAAKEAGAGEHKIILRGGTYDISNNSLLTIGAEAGGSPVPYASGPATNQPFIIENYTGETPVLRYTGTQSGAGGTMNWYAPSNLVVRGIHFDGSQMVTNYANSIQFIKIYGDADASIGPWAASWLTISNCWFGNNPESHPIILSRQELGVLSHVVIHNNTFTNWGWTHADAYTPGDVSPPHAIYNSDVSNVTITHNLFINGFGDRPFPVKHGPGVCSDTIDAWNVFIFEPGQESKRSGNMSGSMGGVELVGNGTNQLVFANLFINCGAGASKTDDGAHESWWMHNSSWNNNHTGATEASPFAVFGDNGTGPTYYVNNISIDTRDVPWAVDMLTYVTANDVYYTNNVLRTFYDYGLANVSGNIIVPSAAVFSSTNYNFTSYLTDFAITTNSAAHNAGTLQAKDIVEGFGIAYVDINGVAFDDDSDGAPDIGAFEYENPTIGGGTGIKRRGKTPGLGRGRGSWR